MTAIDYYVPFPTYYLGAKHSIRLQPNKSNSIVWLNRAWCEKSDLDPDSSWPLQRALITAHLPHADSWIELLQLAREDTGIDIKDDCRLEESSARCHQAYHCPSCATPYPFRPT